VTVFRVFLAVVFVSILAYTAVTISNHGLMTFLALSALWTAWRNHFSVKGLGLAVLAFFGGMLFLSAYLFVLTLKANSSVVQVMIGDRARG